MSSNNFFGNPLKSSVNLECGNISLQHYVTSPSPIRRSSITAAVTYFYNKSGKGVKELTIQYNLGTTDICLLIRNFELVIQHFEQLSLLICQDLKCDKNIPLLREISIQIITTITCN